MNVDIDEFDFEYIKACCVIALFGKRGKGKTTWSKFILGYLNQTIDRFVVYCGNSDNKKEWKESVVGLNVMLKNIEHLRKLVRYQDDRVGKYKDLNKPVPRKYRACVVLDDCGTDSDFMNHPVVLDVLDNGRHYGITLVGLFQHIGQIKDKHREQIDYVGMLHTANSKRIKQVHDEFIDTCPLSRFKLVLKACTQDRGLCWIDTTVNADTTRDLIFYKTLTLPFSFEQVGNDQVQTYSDEHSLVTNTTEKPEAPLDEYSDTDSDEEYNREQRELLRDASKNILDSKTTFKVRNSTVTIFKHGLDKQKID